MLSKLVHISGTRHQVGVALGKLARPIMSVYLDQSSTWHALRPWRDHAYLQILAGHVQHEFPAVWEELQGLSDGLKMPINDVLLWNCRGDLLHHTTDGCTSIATDSADGARWIAHNEDGDPYLYGRCHIVDVQLDDAPGYVSFYYPGSLPGHTFAANRVGIVQTINNLRPHTRNAGVPRMVLARAVLDCTTLDEAIRLLETTPRSGAFHHTLGAAGLGAAGIGAANSGDVDSGAADTPRLFSVEALPGLCSVLPIEGRYGHANHLIHAQTAGVAQNITDSSRARQHRVDSLLDGWHTEESTELQLVRALHDHEGDLPILRTGPDDPDEENTLATAIFKIHENEVKLHIYDRQGEVSQDIEIM